MTNLCVVSYSFVKGGAAIAAKKFFLIASSFPELNVRCVSQDRAPFSYFIKRLLSYSLLFLQRDSNPIKHSINLFSYPPVLNELSDKQALHHIHWINNDTLGIFSLSKIPTASIVTLHDEWLYCGTEHCYDISKKEFDFQNGYSFFQRNVFGLNWNYIGWKIKMRSLSRRTDLLFTVPSRWMKERAESSKILSGKKIRLLPNPIDTDVFCPLGKPEVERIRNKIKIGMSDFIFCFGAIGGGSSTLKGGALLLESLTMLKSMLTVEEIQRIKIVQFGGKCQNEFNIAGFNGVSVGHISKPENLAEIYNASDCVIVPSLVESFGQVAAEALACAVPVVCFSTSGLNDIVSDGSSGLVATPFSAASLADCLYRILKISKLSRSKMGLIGRNHIVSSFSYPVVSQLYRDIINEALQMK